MELGLCGCEQRATDGMSTLKERADGTGYSTEEHVGERWLLGEEGEEGWMVVLKALCRSRPSALVSGVGITGAGVTGWAEGKSPVVTRKG